MKKSQLILTCLLLMISQLGIAQLEKGNLIIGGTAGFNIDIVEDDDNLFTLMLNPTIATFIDDNIAVGGNLAFTYQKNGDASASVLGLLPLVRYYFPGTSESSAFFIEAKAGLARVGFKSDNFDDSETAFQFGIGPGVAFFQFILLIISSIMYTNQSIKVVFGKSEGYFFVDCGGKYKSIVVVGVFTNDIDSAGSMQNERRLSKKA